MARSLRQVRVGNEFFQIDDNNPVDPDFDGKNVSSNLNDVDILSPFNLFGGAGSSAFFYGYSNLGTANEDKWRMVFLHTANEYNIDTKVSGS